ncbi:hypothetical protein HDU96_000057 [Phlyctochytrium bullatum]|nr:hypothetical protein HDU96_000057 [Phlyctochytrium bullatum]
MSGASSRSMFTYQTKIALLEMVQEAMRKQPGAKPHSRSLPWDSITKTLNEQYGTSFSSSQVLTRVQNSRNEWLRKLADGNVMSQTNEYFRLLGDLYGTNTHAEAENANVHAEMRTNDPTAPATSSQLSPSARPSSSQLSALSSHRQSDGTPRVRPTPTPIPTPVTTNPTPTSLAGSKRRRSPSLAPDSSRVHVRWSEAIVLELLRLVRSAGQPVSESDMTSIAQHIRDKFGCQAEAKNTHRKLRELRRDFFRAHPFQDPRFTEEVWKSMRKTFTRDEAYQRRANSMARGARSVSRPRKRSASRRPEPKRKRSVSRARPVASETVVENEVQPVRQQSSVSSTVPLATGFEDKMQPVRRRRSVSRARPPTTGVEDDMQPVRRRRSVSRARPPAMLEVLPLRLRSLSRARPPENYYNEDNMLPDSIILDEVPQTATATNDANSQLPVGPLTTPIESQPVPRASSPARSDSDMSVLTASTDGPTTPFLQSLAANFAVSSNTAATVPDPVLADLSLSLPPAKESAQGTIDWTPAMDADLLRLMIEFTSNATEAGLDDVVSKLAGAHGVFVQFDQLNQRYQELEIMYRASVAAGTPVAGTGELQELLKLAFGGQTANQVEAAEQRSENEMERGRSSSDRMRHRRSVSRGRTRTPRYPPPNPHKSSSRTIDSSQSSRVEPSISATVVVRQPSVSPPVVNNDSLVSLLHQLLENQRTYMATQEQSTTVIKQLRSQIKTLEDTVKDLRTQIHRNEIRNNFASPEPELSVEAITAAVTEALERARKANPIDMETARVFTAELRGYLERKQKTFDSRVDEMKSQVVGAIEEMERKVVKVVGKKVMEEIEDRFEGLAAKVGKDVVAVVEQKLKKMGAVRTGRD